MPRIRQSLPFALFMLLNLPACGVGTLMLDGSKDTDDSAEPADDTAPGA